MFSRSKNVTVSLLILLIWDHSNARLWMLNWWKSKIMNVESVKKWYYECWISLKLWKTSISVLCLFVDMKQLQNKKSQISTDLIQNLKIKIISLSVLNLYFFHNCHFHIVSSILNCTSSFSCTDFSISPMPGPDHLQSIKY